MESTLCSLEGSGNQIFVLLKKAHACPQRKTSSNSKYVLLLRLDNSVTLSNTLCSKTSTLQAYQQSPAISPGIKRPRIS